VLVDARPAEENAENHVSGAVNIPMSSLVINEPVDNMLPEASQIEK
jgi:rhodanese-related sulfurtransferase